MATAAAGATIWFMEAARLRPGVTLADLEAALETAWSRDTSSDPPAWSEANRAWGQCAVTALIVQDYLGGTLRRAEIGTISHYWNVLPTGEELDLTRQQFPIGTEISNAASRTRDYVLSNLETARRYRKLGKRVDQRLRGRVLAAS
jgi:hypothetical protein